MKILPIMIPAIFTTFYANAENFDPAPIKFTDGFFVTPTLTASTRYDDNIYNESSEETSSFIYLLKPSIKFGVNDGINHYGGVYELTTASYSNGSEDNYLDHQIKLQAHTEYTDKHRTDFNFNFSNLHEDRGSDLTETLDLSATPGFDEPLKYNEFNVRGYYQYGGLTSLMRIGGGVSYSNKKYQNFRNAVDDNKSSRFDDVEYLMFFADTDYQVGRVTFVTFDISSKKSDYAYLKDGSTRSNNTDSRALIGLKWEGLGKTTGKFKVGYQYKDFVADQREDFDGYTVELGMLWKPVEYSSFDINLSRVADEAYTTSNADYIEKFGGLISWKHGWTDSFDSQLQFSYSHDDYVGNTRLDETSSAMLRLNYGVTRWLKLTAGYKLTTKDSNDDGIAYDKSIASLGIVASL